jgi:hypothetical protein
VCFKRGHVERMGDEKKITKQVNKDKVHKKKKLKEGLRIMI